MDVSLNHSLRKSVAILARQTRQVKTVQQKDYMHKCRRLNLQVKYGTRPIDPTEF